VPERDAIRSLTQRQSYRLTRAGLFLALSVTSILAVGALRGQLLTMTLGGFGVIGLMAAFWSARLSVYGLVNGGCSVALEPSKGPWRCGLDAPLVRRLTLEGPSARALAGVTITPGLAGFADGECERQDDGWRLSIRCHRLGDSWLQGFLLGGELALGLVRVQVWHPCHHRVEVLPSHFAGRAHGLGGGRVHRARARDRARSSSRAGFGLDLRELRDHQPGDPFKHIAWSATARRGRLVSRVFEAHARRSVWLVLDASPSMFWGPVGRAPIDLAMDAAFQIAHSLISEGDRVGLLVHDDSVRVEIPPASGRTHLQRLLHGILESPHLVHEGNTEFTDQELVDAVAGWFMAQESAELRLPISLQEQGWGGHRRHDEARVSAAARRWLTAQAGRERASLVMPQEAYAHHPNQAVLRAFCRRAGVPLPRAQSSRPGGQAHGIESAVRRVLQVRGGPYTLLLLSDLATTDHLESLRRAARGSRRHHHRVIVACPSVGAVERAAEDELELALQRAEEARARQAFAAVEAFLRPAGVGVLRVREAGGVRDVLRGLSRAV
jgi:uncharacterized protein (DUF58 family)